MSRSTSLAALALAPIAFSSALALAQTRTELGPSVLTVPAQSRNAQQGILTPVPIGLDLPSQLRARRVLVHYKIWGWPEWTTLELSRIDDRRWVGAVPCLEVSTITGDLTYYIRVHDADGAVIAYSGSRYRPYRVQIVHDSLRPGQSAVGRCPDPADCPAGLPGCPSERVEKVPCKSDGDCEGGQSCGWDGYCSLDRRLHGWVTLEAAQELGVVATTGACTVESQETRGYACYRQFDGQNYTGDPVRTNEPLALGLGQTRIVLGYDRLVFYTSSVGVRVGYAVRGSGPTLPSGTDFVPYYGELRFTHWFGSDPFATPGVSPFVFMNGGYAMFDVEVETDVREDVHGTSSQGDNDLEQTLDVWRRAGDVFAGVGAGLCVPLGPATQISGQLAVLGVFPYGALVFQPAVGVRQGF